MQRNFARTVLQTRTFARYFTALLLSLALFHCSAFSQTVPDGYKSNPSIWAGIEYANLQAGFPFDSTVRVSGLGAIVSYSRTHQILIEGQVRVLNWNSWNGETEHDYLAGPRYTFLHSDRLRPFARFEIGEVTINYPFTLGVGHQFAMVPAGGLEYRLGRRWSVRGTYEYQFLPNSPNFTNEPHYGMRPNGASAGITCRVF